MGLKAEGGSIIPQAWVDSLFKAAMEPSPYAPLFGYDATSSTSGTTTTASTEYGTFTVPLKVAFPSGSWSSTSSTSFTPFQVEPSRISDAEMKSVVDKLVKERYPAYDPPKR